MGEIKITCLTPLWTGDIDSKCYLLESSGIMGSLRWWTEAILRSLNYFACDPTDGDNRCPKESRDNNKKLDEYCLSCLIFGATGIRRLFRLEVEGGKPVFSGSQINIRPYGRNRGWYLGSGLEGDITFKIIPLDKKFDINLILIPLEIISKWGGLGAKTQHGYGVIQINTCLEIDFNRFFKAIENITKEENLPNKIKLRNENHNGLLNLTEMFFAKVQFEVTDENWWKKVDGIKGKYEDDGRMISWIKSGSVPIAPSIKNWLRYGDGRNLWQTGNPNNDMHIENWLFGTIRNDKRASKINISCAYKLNDNLWEFRIWGWIPKANNPEGFDRETFLNNLKNALKGNENMSVPWKQLLGDQTKNFKLFVWRKFNSSQDTIDQENNIKNFIESLAND